MEDRGMERQKVDLTSRLRKTAGSEEGLGN
jgi:hypothetical protein